MTTYPQSFFTPTTGILEQLTLAAIAQSIANRSFLPGNVQTDFVKNSVNIAINGDANHLSSEGALSIDLQFITFSFDRQCLISKGGLDRRIASYNSTAIDEIAITRERTYPQQSFPVINLPEYLTSDTDPNNILERRILVLCLQALAVQRWIDRWNECAKDWFNRKYLPKISNDILKVPSLIKIEAIRDALLLELTTGIDYDIADVKVFSDSQLGIAPATEPGTAQEETTYLSGGSGDPLIIAENSGGGGYMSSGLVKQLEEALAENALFGNGNIYYGGSSSPTEKPTLPNC